MRRYPVLGTSWHVYTAKIQIRMRIRTIWSESCLSFLPGDTLNTCQPIKPPSKTLIRLRWCAGWYESLMGAHSNLYFLLNTSSPYVVRNQIMFRTDRDYADQTESIFRLAWTFDGEEVRLFIFSCISSYVNEPSSSVSLFACQNKNTLYLLCYFIQQVGLAQTARRLTTVQMLLAWMVDPVLMSRTPSSVYVLRTLQVRYVIIRC